MATTPLLQPVPEAAQVAERLPATSQRHYLTGKTALNIPSPEGTGDWHFVETFKGFAGRPPGNFAVAGIDLYDTRQWLGDRERC